MKLKNYNISYDSSTRIPFFQLLAIVFIVLKFTGYITWSWLWVLSPIWIFAVIAILILFISALFGKS
jgi:FtsH-binding integral membrane protein